MLPETSSQKLHAKKFCHRMESKSSFDQSLENMRDSCVHMLDLLCKKKKEKQTKIAENKKAGTVF